MADAIYGDQPARAAAVEECRFELGAKTARVSRHGHRSQQADLRPELPSETAQSAGPKTHIYIAEHDQLVLGHGPRSTQIIDLRISRPRDRLNRQPRGDF